VESDPGCSLYSISVMCISTVASRLSLTKISCLLLRVSDPDPYPDPDPHGSALSSAFVIHRGKKTAWAT
jgi:hypothetical protein